MPMYNSFTRGDGGHSSLTEMRGNGSGAGSSSAV